MSRRYLLALVGALALVASACQPAAAPAPTSAPPAKSAAPAAQPTTAPAAQPAAQPTAAAAAPAAGGAVKFSFPKDKLKLGVIEPLTGAASAFGVKATKAMEMAVDHMKAQGANIELVEEDSTGDPPQAAALVDKLAGDNSIVGILGPTRTPEFIAMAPKLLQWGIPDIAPSVATPPPAVPFNKWMFSVTVPEADRIPPVVNKIIIGKYNAKTVAMISAADDDFAKGGADLFRAALQKANIKLVSDETYKTKDTDFSAQLTKIQAANPEVLIFSGLVQEGALILDQSRKKGMKQPWVGGSGFTDPASWYKLSGGASDGAIFATNFLPTGDRPIVKQFAAAWQAKFNEDPPENAAWAYDATLFFADAAVRAGTVTDRAKLRDAVGSMTNFEGTTGVRTYHDYGFAAIEVSLVEQRGGKLVAVK